MFNTLLTRLVATFKLFTILEITFYSQCLSFAGQLKSHQPQGLMTS